MKIFQREPKKRSIRSIKNKVSNLRGSSVENEKISTALSVKAKKLIRDQCKPDQSQSDDSLAQFDIGVMQDDFKIRNKQGRSPHPRRGRNSWYNTT